MIPARQRGGLRVLRGLLEHVLCHLADQPRHADAALPCDGFEAVLRILGYTGSKDGALAIRPGVYVVYTIGHGKTLPGFHAISAKVCAVCKHVYNPHRATRKATMTNEFGRRLRQLGLLRGLNQRELAALLGRSEGQVSRWLNGKVLPDFDSLRQISEALDVSGHWLLTGDGELGRVDDAPRMALSEVYQISAKALGLTPQPVATVADLVDAAAGPVEVADGESSESSG